MPTTLLNYLRLKKKKRKKILINPEYLTGYEICNGHSLHELLQYAGFADKL